MVWRCSVELSWEEVKVLDFLSAVGGEPHSPLDPEMQQHLASALRKISNSIAEDISEKTLVRWMTGGSDV